jgi:SAM-dependent methyltransferase
MGILDLKHKETFSIDDPRRTLQHRDIILSKPFLKRLYIEWYNVFKKSADHLPPGLLIELGSGGGFLKEIIPNVITSDVLDIPDVVDKIFYGENMPFENASVAGIFMTDVFHHIPDSAAFLDEARRVLVKGGKIIMIEPANSFWGRFIYQNFHHEPFNPQGDWHIPPAGPMSGANGALPWIVFERDRKKFEAAYPDLKINKIRYHTPLRYLLSGGVSKRQMAPGFSFTLLKGLENIMLMISRQLSMFMTIEVEKIR